jgi:hypothetical protein
VTESKHGKLEAKSEVVAMTTPNHVVQKTLKLLREIWKSLEKQVIRRL